MTRQDHLVADGICRSGSVEYGDESAREARSNDGWYVGRRIGRHIDSCCWLERLGFFEDVANHRRALAGEHRA